MGYGKKKEKTRKNNPGTGDDKIQLPNHMAVKDDDYDPIAHGFMIHSEKTCCWFYVLTLFGLGQRQPGSYSLAN